jgi:hypothetical protein
MSSNERKHRTVAECFHAHNGRLIDKWESYLDIYERHFARYVGTKVNVLEIGVSHGGSLQLWKSYFGPDASIVGVDIDERCFEYVEDQIEVYIFEQENATKLERISAHSGPWDIVIDDGSHVIAHQEASFKALWPYTKGTYLIEDIHGAMPQLAAEGGELALVTQYPWVLVMERPKRLIRGKPSRELREDEIEAIHLYSDAQ